MRDAVSSCKRFLVGCLGNIQAARPIMPLVLAVASLSLASQAWGQSATSLLPATGLVGGGGNLRSVVESVVPGTKSTVNAGLAWDVSGSIGGTLGATDNGGRSRDGWNLYGTLSPSINVNGDTRLLQVRLSYAPSLNYYGSSSNQTQLTHSLNGTATATIWPETLFVNARAVSSFGSRFGGASVNSAFLSDQDGVQTTSYSLNPYATHRFGGWGTATVGYSVAGTLQDTSSSLDRTFNQSQQSSSSSPGFGTTGNLTTYQETARFVTGENLGRWQDAVELNATQYGRGGSYYRSAYRNLYTNTLSYAFNRSISLSGMLGYEEISFPSVGYHLSEATWNIGTTWTPNPDSSIHVTYGRTEGDTSILLDATYAVTARTSLNARYTNGVNTGLADQQALLGSTGVGVGGILIDRTTGQPVLANSAFGSQFGLSRIKRLSVGAYHLRERDSFSVTVSNEDRTQLSSATSIVGVTTPPGTSSNVTSGSLSWQHSLTPVASVSNGFTYSVSNTGALLGNPGTSFDTLTFTSSLGYTFTQTLTGSVQYSYTERSGGALRGLPSSFGGSATQNVILVGLQKTF
jgi:uncharacterized protein (PEP-CTERM system associated)